MWNGPFARPISLFSGLVLLGKAQMNISLMVPEASLLSKKVQGTHVCSLSLCSFLLLTGLGRCSHSHKERWMPAGNSWADLPLCYVWFYNVSPTKHSWVRMDAIWQWDLMNPAVPCSPLGIPEGCSASWAAEGCSSTHLNKRDIRAGWQRPKGDHSLNEIEFC